MNEFKINKDMLELYGILMGDGCISRFISQGKTHHAIRIDGHSITDRSYYYEHLKILIERVTSRKIKVKFRKEGNCIFIMFEHKKLASFLHEKFNFPFGKKGEIKISNQFLINKTDLTPILKGLFDTDGCLYFTKNNSKIRYYPIIELSTHSKPLVKQLEQILSRLEFKVKISHFGDSVKLHGKENLIKWMGFISSNHPDKLSKFNYWKKFGYCPKIDELSFEERTKKLNTGP